MKFLDKLERKIGRFAVPNLIVYIIVLYGLGALLGIIAPGFYENYLMLDVGAVLRGQVWRLFTFIISPSSISGTFGILFLALKMYLYFMFGRSLENAWGAFRFNLYILGGFFFNIAAAFLVYFIMGIPYPVGLDYTYQAMFFAFAALYPNIQFLLFFIIPVKVKWLAIADAVFMGWDVIKYIRYGVTVHPAYFAFSAAIVVAMANFFIFFFATRNYKKISYREKKRKANFRRQTEGPATMVHRCAVCGRTPADNPDLEFRYCSKCKGNFEYCSDHLFTHEHVK